jgi:hypothetical protein
MGNERHRRVWPVGACHVITIRATPAQLAAWHAATRILSSKPHLGAFIARAADFYAERLQARLELALRMEREGKLGGKR